MDVRRGIAGSVFYPDLIALQVPRYADRGASGALGEGGADGGFVPRDEAAVAVGARVGESEEASREAVFEEPRRIGQGFPGEPVEAVAWEEGFPSLFEELVDVHSAAGHFIEGFGHEGDGESHLLRHGPDDPLGHADAVGGPDEIHEVELDLELGGPYLVVMVFHGDSRLLHCVDGAVAEVEVPVFRREFVVSLVGAEAGNGRVLLSKALGGSD